MDVYLVKNRKALFCYAWEKPEKQILTENQRFKLNEEMLNLQIRNGGLSAEKVSESHAASIRAALRGMKRLDGYNAVVSIGYSSEGKYLNVNSAVWGEIYLRGQSDEPVATFSHYHYPPEIKRERPFISIIQWLEDVRTNTENKEEIEAFEIEWSSPKKWEQFFKQRISEEVKILITLEKKYRERADSLHKRIQAIGRDVQ